MIAPTLITEVRRLLAEGKLSQRKIAQVTGVSRGTVGAVAAGKRPDYETLRGLYDEAEGEPAGPPERCPGCGGMVYLPCRLCRVRGFRAAKSRPVRNAAFAMDALLELNLRPDHQARYEEVRRRRENPGFLLEGQAAR
jgi:transcriptional regulator with XRE-family HTH domain